MISARVEKEKKRQKDLQKYSQTDKKSEMPLCSYEKKFFIADFSNLPFRPSFGMTLQVSLEKDMSSSPRKIRSGDCKVPSNETC